MQQGFTHPAVGALVIVLGEPGFDAVLIAKHLGRLPEDHDPELGFAFACIESRWEYHFPAFRSSLISGHVSSAAETLEVLQTDFVGRPAIFLLVANSSSPDSMQEVEKLAVLLKQHITHRSTGQLGNQPAEKTRTPAVLLTVVLVKSLLCDEISPVNKSSPFTTHSLTEGHLECPEQPDMVVLWEKFCMHHSSMLLLLDTSDFVTAGHTLRSKIAEALDKLAELS